MPPPSEHPLTRVCIRLWQSDYERLRQVSLDTGDIGLNHLIRQIVHSYVTQLNALERRALDDLPLPTMTLDLTSITELKAAE